MNNLIKGFDKKYVIDIWDKEGNFIAWEIQTDYKLLCKNKDDYLYFLIYTDVEEPLEKENTIESIGRKYRENLINR